MKTTYLSNMCFQRFQVLILKQHKSNCWTVDESLTPTCL